jgi:acyl-CoA thioesterase FadM
VLILPRIKLKELDTYRFSTEQQIYISIINPAGHVGSSQMVDLIHNARHQMLKSMGANELNLGDGMTGTILSDLAVNYKAELFLDEIVTIESDIAEIEEKSLRIFYRIRKNGKTAVLAETGHVCFNYAEKSISKVPEVFISKLNEVK